MVAAMQHARPTAQDDAEIPQTQDEAWPDGRAVSGFSKSTVGRIPASHCVTAVSSDPAIVEIPHLSSRVQESPT